MTRDGQNQFAPSRAITRSELANALQMTLGGALLADKRPVLKDVAEDDPLREQLDIVLSNGWMRSGERFAGQTPVTRQEWALACKALVEGYRGTPLKNTAALKDQDQLDPLLAEAVALTVGEGWLEAPDGHFFPLEPVSRDEVAVTLARITGIAPEQ